MVVKVATRKTDDSAQPRYPFEAPPAAGSFVEMVPGIRWLRMPLPFALDHINIWLLEGEAGWALVDTGIGTVETKDIWRGHFQEIRRGGGLERLVVTHYHPDHIGLAGWLSKKFTVDVTMTEAEFLTGHLVHLSQGTWSGETLARHFAEHGLDDERCRMIADRPNSYRRLVPELPGSFEGIGHGDLIKLGRHDWRVIITRGHAPEHACLHSEDAGVLIAGDQLLPKITSNVSVWPAKPASDPLRLYLDSLRTLSELPEDTLVLPSHGLPFYGSRERTLAIREHHRERLGALAAACEQPRCAAEVLPVLFRRKLDDHGIFFAMGEAIAHLNHLWLQGVLERRTDRTGVLSFQTQVPAGAADQ